MAVDDASRKGDLATEAETGAAAVPSPVKPKLAVAKRGPAAVPATEKNKVVHIVRRLEEETSRGRALKRGPWLVGSLVAAIAIPTFLAAIYYVFVASDRFVSEARFAIRSDQTQALDALGMITGMPSSETSSDSYIVADYILSRDMVKELERRLPFRAMYLKGDFVSRLSSSATLEDLVTYWGKRVDVYFDPTKSTIDVEVQAFDAADADRITSTIVDVVRNLVNDLSAQSRRDAVQFAASEVARAELRVRGARDDLLKFRLAHNELDPVQSAEATLGVAGGLQGERSKILSDLASVSGYLADDAPSVRMMKSRLTAINGEIARIQGQVSNGPSDGLTQSPPAPDQRNAGVADTGGTSTFDDANTALTTEADAAAASAAGSPAANSDDAINELVQKAVQGEDAGKPDGLANIVGAYQGLTLNEDFAEKAYAAAMASLDHARAEANRTQAYLAIYVEPSPAETAMYPRRKLNILMIFVLSCVLWGVGMLGTLTVRDHVR